MQLAREYLQRHGLNVPVVIYNEHQTFFGRSEVGGLASWKVLAISYKPDNHHPGHYQARVEEPVHNGGQRGKYFNTVDTRDLEWDQYEDFLLDFAAKQIDGKPVATTEEATLVAWEMFVYCCDADMARYAHNDNMMASLDTSLAFDKRLKAHSDMLLYLRLHQAVQYDQWTQAMGHHLKNYAHWMANLVKV